MKKEWRALEHMLLIEFHAVILLASCVLLDGSPTPRAVRCRYMMQLGQIVKMVQLLLSRRRCLVYWLAKKCILDNCASIRLVMTKEDLGIEEL